MNTEMNVSVSEKRNEVSGDIELYLTVKVGGWSFAVAGLSLELGEDLEKEEDYQAILFHIIQKSVETLGMKMQHHIKENYGRFLRMLKNRKTNEEE